MPKKSSQSAGKNEEEVDTTPVKDPHPHDVLCGRGGMTNQHPGNEWFRRLVRSNRPLYRKCPKHTKLLVAKAIVQAVQTQEPPGRFLERADKVTWKQITYKRAVDKTSQALREKDSPADTAAINQVAIQMGGIEAFKAASAATANTGVAVAASAATSKDLNGLMAATLKSAGMNGSNAKPPPSALVELAAAAESSSKLTAGKKRKKEQTFVKPSWWSRGTPIATGATTNVNAAGAAKANPSTTGPRKVPIASTTTAAVATTNRFIPPSYLPMATGDGGFNSNKKMKPSPMGTNDEPLPPMTGLQARQSSMFRFLSNSGIFGGGSSSYSASSPATAAAASAVSGSNVPPLGAQASRQFSAFGSPGSFFSFSRGTSQPYPTTTTTMTTMGRMNLQEQRQMATAAAAAAKPDSNPSSQLPFNQPDNNVLQTGGRKSYENAAAATASSNLDTKPPAVKTNKNGTASMPVRRTHSSDGSLEDMPTTGLFPTDMTEEEAAVAPPPPSRGLTAQMSDWLSSFFPSGQSSSNNSPTPPAPAPAAPKSPERSTKQSSLPGVSSSPVPPPPGGGGSGGEDKLSRSVSSSIFGLVDTPSQLLTNLKTGLTTMFGNDPSSAEPLAIGATGGGVRRTIPPPSGTSGSSVRVFGEVKTGKRESLIDDDDDDEDVPAPKMPPTASTVAAASAPVFGEVTKSKRESLIDSDDEESPMETKLRDLKS